jgi:hypothetical protein
MAPAFCAQPGASAFPTAPAAILSGHQLSGNQFNLNPAVEI